MTLTPELGRRLYTDMWRIRHFEEEALRHVLTCATTTTSSAPTAATAIAWRRARRWSA